MSYDILLQLRNLRDRLNKGESLSPDDAVAAKRLLEDAHEEGCLDGNLAFNMRFQIDRATR